MLDGEAIAADETGRPAILYASPARAKGYLYRPGVEAAISSAT
jgi:hypothetical protein